MTPKKEEDKKNRLFIFSKENNLNLFLRIVGSLVIIVLLYFLAKELIKNTSSIRNLVISSGVFGPITLIVLMVLGILFTPVPYFVLIITAGYLYGIWQGALYSYLAQVLAAIGTFTLTKLLNIKFKSKRYERYKDRVKRNKKILYVMYMLPVIPISVTSIISASSKMKWKPFLKIVFISFIPGALFFSFFGNNISTKNIIIISISLLITIFAVIVFIKKFKFKIFSKNGNNGKEIINQIPHKK